MPCWNGLSAEQQHRLVTWGNLPINYQTGGPCPNGAEVAVETQWDEAPGPRFLCLDCALGYLALRRFGPLDRPDDRRLGSTVDQDPTQET